MSDPQTPAEWQQAVDAAAGLRAIEDCRMYGLITGGPKGNPERCDEILDRGAELGITPSRPAATLALQLLADFNEERRQS
jgi:hypothetical protein